MSRAGTAATLGLIATVLWSGLVVGEAPIADGTPGGDTERRVRHSEVVLLGARALFGNDGATLSDAGEAALARLVDRLAGYGEIVAIRVVGHADSVGAAAYNRRLSERRAEVVGRAIARRYPAVPIDTEGAGESEPVASNATPDGRARNRRVEIHVLALDEEERTGSAAVPSDRE